VPTTGEITDFEDFTGRADAFKNVEVQARVTGYLDKIHFKDGGDVEAGDLLFTIDQRPYKAALDRAEATVDQAEAKAKRTELDYKRYSALYGRGQASKEEYDMYTDNYSEAKAAVGIAQADLETARTNMDYTLIRAPIAGRISRRMVDVGNLIKADMTMLTTIVALDPMYVYFDVDERTLLRIRRLIREGKVQTRAQGEVNVYVALADETDFRHKGTIDFSENRLDPGTGTLRIRAVIPNPILESEDTRAQGMGPQRLRMLSPGLFLRVRLPIGKPHQSVMIAEKAIGTDQGRKFVYVVGPKNIVEQRTITVGPMELGLRVVESGLKTGERVVVSGLQRMRDGAKVDPQVAGAIVSDKPDKAKPPVVRGG
jgi:RND family efflux transporter MFP subunit